MSSIDSLLTRSDKTTKNTRRSSGPYNAKERHSKSSDSDKWSNDMYIKSIGGSLGARMVDPALLTKQSSSSSSSSIQPSPSLESRISGLANRKKSKSDKNKTARAAQNTRSSPPPVINIRGSSSQPTQITVSNLATGTSPDDVKVALSSHGDIVSASLNPVASSEDSLAVNIYFEKKEDALAAAQAFDGLVADGKMLSVKVVESTKPEDVQSLFADSKMYADTITPPEPEPEPVPSPKQASKKKDKKPPSAPKAMAMAKKVNAPAKPVLSLLERTQMQPKGKKGDNKVQSQNQGQQGVPSLLARISGGAGGATTSTANVAGKGSAKAGKKQNQQASQPQSGKSLAERLGL
ncbi:hypothetical protein E3P99_01361 [Wallemia hederae]|uniref:RRM domain-containing protein n=1 Tax=Wallemia hederae TaxID=1540922 RepID=A0A4T0FQ37_9BASI|nr:hypothetical protein E3P99_01361 [Wallemia hederae]